MIDAGMVAPAEAITVPLGAWLEASPEDLKRLQNLPLYANQQVSVQEELMSGDVKVRVRYRVPCITTLKERA